MTSDADALSPGPSRSLTGEPEAPDPEPGRLGGSAQRPARFFSGPDQFRAWLERNHATASELWVGRYKKHVPDRGLDYADAVREALCFGWIDSVVQRIDDDAVRQRWTPRRRGSTWSRTNLDAVEQLRAQGRMTPAGLAAYEARSEHGARGYAHEQGGAALPAHLSARLEADPRAAAFWAMATPSFRKEAAHWVVSAARESTRESRLARLVEDCAAGRLPAPWRYGTEPAWAVRAADAVRALDRDDDLDADRALDDLDADRVPDDLDADRVPGADPSPEADR